MQGALQASSISLTSAYTELLKFALQSSNADDSKLSHFYFVPSAPTHLGSTDVGKHNADVNRFFDAIPNDNQDSLKSQRAGSFSNEWSQFASKILYPSDQSSALNKQVTQSLNNAEESRSNVS